MDHIREIIKEGLEGVEDYTLKTDSELIEAICKFGCGETEFHTSDIERIIREKHFLEEKVKRLTEQIEQLRSFDNRTFKVLTRNIHTGRQSKKWTYTSYEDFKKYSPDIIRRYSRMSSNIECYELINGEWELIQTTIMV